MQTEPTSGLPEILDMNRIVDDIRVSYYLGIRLDKVGRAVVSSPWSYLFSLLPRAFKKDDKLSDGLVIFYKASNQVDLTFNAVEVATVATSKKGVILKEADRFDPEFIVQMGNDLVDDTDCFGTSTQAADLCKAMEQQVREFNKRANVVSYYIDFLDFPYNLTPGTYQWEHTSDIAEDGLSSRLLEIASGEAGYFIVVGIEDQEGEDDLVDKEPEDVRANARKKAEERMRNRRKSKSAGAAATAGRPTVDDIADDLSSLKFDDAESTAVPRRSYLASPTQLRQSYYKLLGKSFQSMVKGESGALGCMNAIAASLLLRGDEVDAKQLFAEALQELYDEADYYSNMFRLDVTELGNDLAAQLQALVNTRGIYLEVFEFDDYRGGANIPKPETFESREVGPVAVVSI
eukprot:scaffold18366_cov71-Skeletonema_dohrnii-CCMP3373.AAC.1